MAKKKVGKKVRCSVCEAYYNKFCTTKRVMVSANKKRSCDKFVYDKNKVKNNVPIPTTRVTFAEKEALRDEHKEELKELKKRIEENSGKMSIRPAFNSNNIKHPITGDLSRFTTTGSKDEADENN